MPPPLINLVPLDLVPLEFLVIARLDSLLFELGNCHLTCEVLDCVDIHVHTAQIPQRQGHDLQHNCRRADDTKSLEKSMRLTHTVAHTGDWEPCNSPHTYINRVCWNGR